MGRRKSKFMEDDDSSDSDNSNGDAQEDDFDPNDEDAAADRELFKNPYARQKKKPRYDEDLDEGDWGGSKNNHKGKGKEKRTDYTKGQSFVAAGSSFSTQPSKPIDNLSTTYSIESEIPNAEEVPMELDSDIDSSDSSSDNDDEEEEELNSTVEDSLASIPGLNQPKDDLPAFTSRGIGMRVIESGGGIGSKGMTSGGGIGSSRGGGGGGIGSKGDGVTSSLSKPLLFASATSASAMPLGGFGSTPTTTDNQPTSGTASPMTEAATPRAGLGSGISSRAGIGGGGGGIGSQPRQSLADSIRSRLAASNGVPDSPTESNDTDSNPASPSASTNPDESPRERRSFLPTAKALNKPVTVGKISLKEQQHFRSLQAGGDLGFKLLEKMGWTSGTGLGASGQGIVTPIGEGQKMRKKGAGIASGERSAGSIAEAKRMKGEDPDELDKASARKPTKAAVPKAVRDVWQQPKKKTPKWKAEYKTYEQIVADAGGENDGVGLLVDLSGNALSASALSSLPAFGAGSADPTRLPELRHNLSLLTSTTFASLSSLAREGKAVDERRLYLDHEEGRIRKAVESQEHSIRRLEAIKKSIEKISEIERETMELLLAVESSGGGLDPEMFLKPFVDEFDELFGNFSKEYEEMRLDEVIVGAIAPIVRRLLANWDPLTSPSYVVSSLKRWKKHFLIDKDVISTDGTDIDVYGAAHHSNGGSSAKASDRMMTPYESMLWAIWLPRVRSAINNSWSPSNPLVAVNILTSWFPILPLFLRDNTLDQLIMPKVLKAITDWSPSSVKRGGASLHTIVFPWLEHAGERMEQILEEARRKVRAWLKAWKATDGVPVGMDLWQEAFPSSDWDTLVLKHVLPQLGTTLREAFSINPRQQDLKPLEDVMAWAPLIRSTMLSQLLESGFFPKWLNALYVWLTSEKPNFDQVAQWYSYWKSYFPDHVLALSGVSRGFRKGLDLMNQAMALGDDAKYRLKRPDTTPKLSSTSSSSKSSKLTLSNPSSTSTNPIETSFKSIVEEIASASNLLFLSTNQVNEKGFAIYRVSKTLVGTSGIRVYLDGDVVWVRESEGEWKPVGIEEMVKRALK